VNDVAQDNLPKSMSWSKLHAAGALGASKVLKDGACLAHRDRPADVVWFLAAGLLEVYQTCSNERSYLARIVEAPTVVCLKECIAGEDTYVQSVRVLEQAELVPMPRSFALGLLRDNAELCQQTLVEVSRAFCGAARLECNRTHSAESLLANVLLAYASACGESWDGGVRLRVKRTQLDFAKAIGTNERTVNRVLTSW
jgi:CRP-like cAMP-binding protein